MPSPQRRQINGSKKDKSKPPKDEIIALKRMVFDLESTRNRLQTAREHAQYHDTPLSWANVAEGIKSDMLDLSYVNRRLKKKIQMHAQTSNLLMLWVSHQSLHTPVPSTAREMWQSSHLMLGDTQLRKTACEWISKQMIHNTPSVMAEIPFPHDAEDQIEVGMLDNGEGVKVMAQFMLLYPYDQVCDAVWKAEESFLSTLLRLFETKKYMCGSQMSYINELVGNGAFKFELKTLSYLSSGEDQSIMAMRNILQDDAHPIDKKTWTMDLKVWHVMDKCGPELTRVRNYFTMSLPFTKRGFVSIEDFARFQDIPLTKDTRLLRKKVQQRSREGHTQQRWQWKAHVLKVLHEHNDERGSPSYH